MIKLKRYHPLTMVLSLWELIKSMFFFAIILFVFNHDSETFIMRYGRIAFYIIIIISLGVIIYNWLTRKYMLVDGAFHLHQGIAKKKDRRIPLSSVHNVQRHTSFLHRLFKITSATFETSMTGEDAAVRFTAISFSEVEHIEELMTEPSEDSDMEDDTLPLSEMGTTENKLKRTIHFKPTRKDTIKAAFTSFSFLLLVPIILSIYIKLDDIFDLDDKADGVFQTIMSSWWFIAGILVVLIVASIIFGLARAFIKYGKYEISSDDERIFITRGMIDELAFSITKDKVQAIEMTQPLMKRTLGLAEVKLISAGSFSTDDSETEASSLYPFLPVDKAYQMFHDILPSYEVSTQMDRLPKKSLWMRLLRPSWLWMIATGGLFYFKPAFFNIEQAWWMVSIVLLILIIVARILDFMNTRYTINGQFIQFKTGSLETSLFISKRDKVVEIDVSRNKVQHYLGLASIHMVNRAKPVHHTRLLDVPTDVSHDFYTWYANRIVEVNIE